MAAPIRRLTSAIICFAHAHGGRKMVFENVEGLEWSLRTLRALRC
jgi:hypothetical protein